MPLKRGMKTVLYPSLAGRAEHRSDRGNKTRGCLSEG